MLLYSQLQREALPRIGAGLPGREAQSSGDTEPRCHLAGDGAERDVRSAGESVLLAHCLLSHPDQIKITTGPGYRYDRIQSRF